MFELITLGKKLIVSIKTLDISAILRGIGPVTDKIADLYDALKNGVFFANPNDAADYAEFCAEYDQAIAEFRIPAGADPAGALNFDKILAFLEKIKALLSILK